jgi:hypothetical protein
MGLHIRFPETIYNLNTFFILTISHSAMLALLMEAVNTSETSVDFYHTTWRSNPEDSHLQVKYIRNKRTQAESCSTIPPIQVCGMQGRLIQAASFLNISCNIIFIASFLSTRQKCKTS